MKKIIISLCLIFVLLFSGCSCNSMSKLSFENNWNDNQTIGTVSHEEAFYQVNLVKDFSFGDSYNFKADTTKDNFDYDFNGSATMVTDVLTLPTSFENSSSDILDSSVNHVIHLTFDLNITASYKYDDMQDFENYDNYVNYEVYFVANSSFTPIYSYYKSLSTIPFLSDSSVEFATSKSEYKTYYTKNNYTLTDILNQKDYSYSYTADTVIDNNELLFVLRNINLDNDNKTTSVPVINPSYLQNKDLGVIFADNENQSLTITSNEQSVTDHVISKGYAFSLQSSVASCSCSNLNVGKEQLVFIQDGINNVLKTNRRFIVKYIEPLVAFGSFERLGALEYKLTEVNYN